MTESASGATQTTYSLPYGETIVDTTPPAGFDPLTATDAQLQEYGFPVRPNGGTALQDWDTAMQAFSSDAPPTDPLTVSTASAPTPAISGEQTKYGPWAGFTAGSFNEQNDDHIAIKATFTVTSAPNCTADGEPLSEWIGLGGTTSPPHLLQEGVECGEASVSRGNGFRPFQEFVSSNEPVGMCGYSGWVLPSGDTVYANLGYERGSKVANFYLEDETTGVGHGCPITRPFSHGWSFDGNTADWIVEAPTGVTAPFSTVYFRDTQAENNLGNWIDLGDAAVVTRNFQRFPLVVLHGPV